MFTSESLEGKIRNHVRRWAMKKLLLVVCAVMGGVLLYYRKEVKILLGK